MTFDELVDLHVSALEADTEAAWSVVFESLVKHYTKEELEFLTTLYVSFHVKHWSLQRLTMEEIETYQLTNGQVDAIELLIVKAIGALRADTDLTREQQEAFAVYYNNILLALNR